MQLACCGLLCSKSFLAIVEDLVVFNICRENASERASE